MADFAFTYDEGVLPVYINLDYVVRIDRGLDPKEPTIVRFAGGEKITMSRGEGDKLVAQLNLCCKRRTEGTRSRQSRTRRERPARVG
jgi:hypothetical protein